ncbi:rhodanese-related sulfurtransferase [Kineosphaera limosa]|uniref:Rhodanese domain-containing protein n=1 Tax=Kineosphaera limosa NBRC 100340 TaxID=1184609 RepID=K6XFB1_9MICO|nr:rhodanese-like domain-containing protein [Kineosphaera limosa]NYE00617.1 rhodanese-related sulfurtransferase [Kineosphaera limosa]GAB97529.1 hypothetical protein KILIM_073_00090 [Kineosphaera limosa NBRC 100340]
MSTIPDQAPSDVPCVTPESLPDNAVLLDVREAQEFAAGRAPNAVHIPLGQLPEREEELPKERPIVVTCREGERSARATAFLVGQGYWAVNLAGGMLAWHRSNRPLAHDGPGIPWVE